MTTYALSVSQLAEAMERTDFRGANLHPRIANCTGVAAGVWRVLPTEDVSIVSVYDVEGLVHSAVFYEGVLFDSRGQFGEGKDTFISWSTDFTQEDVDAALYSGTVEEFIRDEYIEEYQDPSEVPHNTAVADEAERLFRETLDEMGVTGR